MPKLEVTCLIPGSQTGGAVSVFEEVNRPGEGPPLHAHRIQTEIFHVIEGELEFVVGGKRTLMGAGGCVMVPPGVPHTFRNVGGGPARFHFELLPSGNAEEFFDRLRREEGEINDPDGFFGQYGMDLLGPPLG